MNSIFMVIVNNKMVTFNLRSKASNVINCFLYCRHFSLFRILVSAYIPDAQLMSYTLSNQKTLSRDHIFDLFLRMWCEDFCLGVFFSSWPLIAGSDSSIFAASKDHVIIFSYLAYGDVVSFNENSLERNSLSIQNFKWCLDTTSCLCVPDLMDFYNFLFIV